MSILGEKIGEGKTKVIYKSEREGQVIIVSKDSITAGDGAKKDVLPLKSEYSTSTTCNVFRVLRAAGVVSHFLSQENPTSFRAVECKMIPLEVIVRRIVTGSYLKRNPSLKEGTVLNPTVVEFTFKDDASHDPLVTNEEVIAMNLIIGGVPIENSVLEYLKNQAQTAFEVLEKAWKALNVTLVDFKVEFGVTPKGEVILGDVIDNDSWRIWPKGDKSLMMDKQVYRNLGTPSTSSTTSGTLTTEQTEMIVDKYKWVAHETSKLIDHVLPIPSYSGSNFQGQKSSSNPLVGVVMGSNSDWETMKQATSILESLGVPFEARIVSAHRTPERLFQYAKEAKGRGLRVIIAGAGGAAHLPGMVASLTTLPVLGVPVQSKTLSGVDSLLSIVQMPQGIPVGTLSIGGAANAGLLAASIIASSSKDGSDKDLILRIERALEEYRKKQTDSVPEIPFDNAQHGSTIQSNPIISILSKGESSTSENNNNLKITSSKDTLAPGATIGKISN
eukprot:TRINITY_DN10511_c0_g1_i1.p1 TRINITY_DN10511_c0_g1~~TRINITY_DN10511_c0_g1_i1.p1  ORF type:complete len:502 (-),score=100.17 TRINITY_DN10511_c0_g1_i1:47-1552(-)